VLGSLAFATVIARGLVNATGAKSTVGDAVLWMAGMAAVGYLVGRLAEWIVDDSVRARMAAELAQQDAKQKQAHESAA
jgi:membrane protein YqaA with SNARE-associated domain